MRLNNKNGVNLLYAETENNDNKRKIKKKINIFQFYANSHRKIIKYCSDVKLVCITVAL